ncbi:MAG: hypothetical protein JJV93_02740 [Alphaproteobacteria bacterium]|nr:hypothetical protein [Alphaproteobacteria bacterium]MBL0718146.1 hypothetical protein [Alphaproteobacteria bacterium]
MSVNIESAFIKHFEAEVHSCYQQMGTKLRNTVRTKNNIVGSNTVFQKVGKGVANTKSRHGMVPVMNLSYEPVECLLQDYYAGDWVDALDELKTNIDERRVVASAGAYALGQKTDELIINKLNETTQNSGDFSTGLTKEIILKAVEQLNSKNVPDDGQRFAVVGVHQWNELLQMDEFVKSDYVGDAHPLLNGSENRKWMGIVWILHNELPISDSDERSCFIYHKSAIGHAVAQDIKTDISWHGERASFFVSNSMSQGSALIDDTGIVKLCCNDLS